MSTSMTTAAAALLPTPLVDLHHRDEAMTSSDDEDVMSDEVVPSKRFKLIVPDVKVKVTPVKKQNDKLVNKQQKCVLDSNGAVKQFSDIQVSTRTAIVFTNCTVDLAALFLYAPITDYKPPVNRRGRKPTNHVEPHVAQLPFGSVVRVAHELKVRGVKAMKPKSMSAAAAASEESTAVAAVCPTGADNKKQGFFRHCVVLDVAISRDGSNKFKNVKIYSNGKMQITGCKSDEQYYDTVEAVFNMFQTIEQFIGQPVVTCNEPSFKAVFNTVMQNMDFNMGFSIFRRELDRFINTQTEFKSVFDGTNNPGVNIRIPISETESRLMSLEYNRASHELTKGYVDYADYKSLIKSKKEREHTFLIFHTGHVIFTSAGSDMESVFYRVINLLTQNRHLFEAAPAK